MYHHLFYSSLSSTEGWTCLTSHRLRQPLHCDSEDKQYPLQASFFHPTTWNDRKKIGMNDADPLYGL